MSGGVGHNRGPIKLDLRDELADLKSEAEHWLDGQRVESEAQMTAVNAIIDLVKDLDIRFKAEKEIEYRPHKAAADAVIADYKPDLDELAALKKGLLAIVEPFRKKLAAEKEAAAREAYRIAEEARRAALEAQDGIDWGDIASRQEADSAALSARQAEMAAQQAKDDKVKGLRKVTTVEVDHCSALINYIIEEDPAALMFFLERWATKHWRETKVAPAGCVIISSKVAT